MECHHMISQVTYGSNYMLEKQSHRVRQSGKEEGGSLKRVTSTHERGNLHSNKGSPQTIS